MYRQGSSADLSQSAAGQVGRVPAVLRPLGLSWDERARTMQRGALGTSVPGLATE